MEVKANQDSCLGEEFVSQIAQGFDKIKFMQQF